MLLVSHFPDSCSAVNMDFANFAGAEPKLSVAALSRQKLNRCSRGSCYLRALSGLHFNAMHRRPDWNVPQWKRVSRLDGSFGSRQELNTGDNPPRGNNVAPLSIDVAQQRNVGAAIRVIFQSLDARRNPILVPNEIDDPVVPLAAAALMPHCDAARIIPT